MDHWLSSLFSPASSNRVSFPSRFPFLVLLILTACFLWQCQNKEDQPAPSVSSQSTDAAQPEHTVATSAPPPISPPTIPIVETQVPTACCEVVANPELKGRLGRLIVNFPDGANLRSTRIDVYKPGEPKAINGGYGGQTFDLLPSTYEVEISKKRLIGVSIQSAHDTKIKVGILQVNAGESTRIDVVDGDGQTLLVGGYGDQTFGLPVGTFQVRVAGQSESVSIEEGKVTEF